MPKDALPEDWAILRDWLPPDLGGLARQCGFIQRERGLTDAECWLRLILMHVAGGLSLEQTTMRARELKLADVSAVALFKRLRQAEDLLRRLCEYVLREIQRRLGASQWPAEYKVRAVDASCIQEPGQTGSTWRLHYSIRLPELICDHYELTDEKGGEKFGRFQFAKGELVLADRGYNHRSGAAHVLDSGAELLMRWSPSIFPVVGLNGEAFDLLQKLRALPLHRPGEWRVAFEHQGKRYPVRICAIRKTREATERAQRKVRDKARCHGSRSVNEQSLELAEYILVLTSLPTKYKCPVVLELYRCRWQVELAFKRLKTLLQAGHLPKSRDQSARSWMQAKILTALLLERLLLEAEIFSPWGFRLPLDESMAHFPGG